jgi:neutral ceramidase
MKIGIAETDVRTPIGMQMTGYGGRVIGALDINDQLKISAVYMESKGVKTLLMVCQILGFDPGFSRETELKISEALNIPVSNIMIHSIHTHAGPASGTLYGCGIADKAWLEETQGDLIRLAKEAEKNLFEGYLDYFAGECGIGMNRVALLYKDELPYQDIMDKQVGVIRIFESNTDRLKGVIVNYGCHPVTLGNSNYTYTADYPYFTIRKLEEEYGDGVTVIFTTGCCGDIDPKERGSFEKAKANGENLADSVKDAMFKFKNSTDADIRCNASELTLPLSVLSKEEYKRIYEEALDSCKKMIENKYSPSFAHVQAAAVRVLWADRGVKGYENNTLMTEVHPLIRTWKIGELVFVAMPFEIFHELGLRVKELFGKENTVVLGYTGGVFGYLPYGAMYDRSVYEVKSAHLYYGYPGPLAKEAGDIILDYLKKLI